MTINGIFVKLKKAITASVFVLLFSASLVAAAQTTGGGDPLETGGGDPLPTGGTVDCSITSDPSCQLPSASTKVELTNPLTGDGKPVDAGKFYGTIVAALLSVTGTLALVIFVFGGLTWMTAGGNSEKVQKGKDTLMWAAIGLVTVFGSYIVLRFIISTLISVGGQT